MGSCKTKALATAYYGSAPKYAYWEGGSTGGRQGLEFIAEQTFDLVLLDLRMPDLSGIELLKALKELSFDHDMHKISTEDYEKIAAGYRARAVRVMRSKVLAVKAPADAIDIVLGGQEPGIQEALSRLLVQLVHASECVEDADDHREKGTIEHDE